MKRSNNEIGAKARVLLKLKKKFSVPRFFVLSTSSVDRIFRQAGVSLARIRTAFVGSPEDRKALRRLILGHKLQSDFQFLQHLGADIIIRSAIVGEDGCAHSFAGIYESQNTKNNPANFSEALCSVLSVAFSERVVLYARQIGLKEFPRVSLIVQEYLSCEFAGVTFTETTYQNKTGMLINLVQGSGEKAVRGEQVTELFIQDGRIPPTQLPKQILSQVARQCRQVQTFLGSPQDVEWCYKNQRVYILQSRPITSPLEAEVQVWDSSNIAESYSGIVLPLTCSFARLIYRQVYRDVARTSSVSPRKIEESSDVFDNLLGFFYGRFYYNMLNWYKMLALFPSYKRNKRNLHLMISAQSEIELDARHKANVCFRDKLAYYSHTLKRLLTFESDLWVFKFEIKNYLQCARQKELHAFSLPQLWAEFEDYQTYLLKKWSITVDNDFLAMTWFGWLKKYATKHRLGERELMSSLTSTSTIVSAEQVTCLRTLAAFVYQDPQLRRLARAENWSACYSAMSKKPELKKRIDVYLETYGGRFANELKLEAKDLDSDPLYLPQILYSYFLSLRKLHPNLPKPSSYSRGSFAFNFLCAKTKHYLAHREELRLLRSQAFSFTRKLFIAIGKKLDREGVLSQPDDIFYLTLEEIQELIFQSLSFDAKKRIRNRKTEYQAYSKITLDRVLYTRGNQLPEVRSSDVPSSKSILNGVGCSQGMVTGRVTVLSKFVLPKTSLEIVVVKHTDPGWTPLFGLCKGLIVQHGGMLSHAAIIARELGLPCVIGVEHATTLLKTGQSVKLDATNGRVYIVPKDGAY